MCRRESVCAGGHRGYLFTAILGHKASCASFTHGLYSQMPESLANNFKGKIMVSSERIVPGHTVCFAGCQLTPSGFPPDTSEEDEFVVDLNDY